MSTFTTNFNLTKPAVGSDENTWGNLLNGDLDVIDAQLSLSRSRANAGVVHIPSLNKGTVYSGASTVGGLKVKLPALKSDESIVSFWVDIHDTAVKYPVSFFVSGRMYYTGSIPSWASVLAAQVGGIAPIPVTFGDDGVNRVVMFGSVAGTWSYVSVLVRDVMCQTNGVDVKLRDSDWNIAVSAGALVNTSVFTPSVPNDREPAIVAGTAAQYWRGDKTWQTLDKTAIALGNVDNTSDVNKPVSTAQQTALNAKANTASPSFTGDVTAGNALISTGGQVNTHAPAGLNAHVWFKDETGATKFAAYWDRVNQLFTLNYWGLGNSMQFTAADQVWRIGWNPIYHAGNAGKGAPDAVLEDQKASGTNSQTPTINSWLIHNLNTKVRDPSSLITITSNTFVTTATGWLEWDMSLRGSGQSRLYNVTDSLVAGYGSTIGTSSGGTTIQTFGGAAIIAGKTYRLEFNSVSDVSPVLAASRGGPEIYTRASFWRT